MGRGGDEGNGEGRNEGFSFRVIVKSSPSSSLAWNLIGLPVSLGLMSFLFVIS